MSENLSELLSKITPENRHEEIGLESKAAAALARFLSDMDLGSPKMDDDYSLRLAEMRALLEPKEPVKVKRLHPNAVIPSKAHTDDAGFDIVAVEDTVIEPGETALIKTGLAFELPQGYEMQIRPRSGVTLKTTLRVQLGTVDSNYRGEVGVIVDNTYSFPPDTFEFFGNSYSIDGSVRDDLFCKNKHKTYIIRKGDRIAQAIIQRLPDVKLIEVEALGDSERGADGFGSTGVRDKYTASICEGCNGDGYVRFRNGGDEDCTECDGEGMRLKVGD